MTINADNVKSIPCSGSWGNANKHHAYGSYAGEAAGEEMILMEVGAGTTLMDLRAKIAALGASTTLSFGWRYKNGEAGGGATALEAAASTVAASNVRGTFTPVTFAYDAYITCTTGGGAATGRVDAVLDYVYNGNL